MIFLMLRIIKEKFSLNEWFTVNDHIISDESLV